MEESCVLCGKLGIIPERRSRGDENSRILNIVAKYTKPLTQEEWARAVVKLRGVDVSPTAIRDVDLVLISIRVARNEAPCD